MKDLNYQQCLQVLSNNCIGRIAFIYRGNPEIIPITYYYNPEQHSIISYSAEGTKIKAMRQNKSVTFQADEIYALDKWKSVLAHGKYEELNSIDAKHVLRLFTDGVKELLRAKEKIQAKYISEFSSKIEDHRPSIIYRINITDVVGRER